MGRRDNIDAFRDAMGKTPEDADRNKKKEESMSYLKGNYNLKKTAAGDKLQNPASEAEKNAAANDSTTAFEKFAREKLGGSIAFVMKKSTFVWEGPDAKDASAVGCCDKDEKKS